MPGGGHEDRIACDIAFLRGHGVPLETLREATRLAEAWGVPAVEAFLSAGSADPDRIYRALAAELGVPFLGTGWSVHPLTRFPEALVSGIAPLAPDPSGATTVLAPRGAAFGDLLGRGRRLGPGLAIATPAGLRDAVFRDRAEAVARHAAEDLARRRPDESFHGGVTLGQIVASHLLAMGLMLAAIGAGGTLWAGVTLLVGLPFLGLACLKLAAALEPAPVRMPPGIGRTRDRDLPVYTILVPLYREGRILPRLVAAMRALDYPAGKLDVKLLTEAGDTETASAIAALDLPGFIEVVIVPPGAPRTKPRALNVGLALARGSYLVVYDAEDVPHPRQLRDAVAIFQRSEPDVACLQARLVIDNTRDGLLPRFFTVEYATLFDVLNPALARFDLPVPLGGTSNHLNGIR